MTATTTRPAGRAELKGGLVALSLAAIVGGWAALTGAQARQTDAQSEPPPPAQPQSRVQSVDLPPIPTVVPLAALVDTAPAGQLPSIPSVVVAPAQSLAAPSASLNVAALGPLVVAPAASPIVAPVAPPIVTAPAPSLASSSPAYKTQQSAPTLSVRVRTRSSR